MVNPERGAHENRDVKKKNNLPDELWSFPLGVWCTSSGGPNPQRKYSSGHYPVF